MIWFTADPHFGHANIIKYCNRPFADVDEMDDALIRNWNSCVKKDEHVYVLGDFSFAPPQNYFPLLNGHKHLIIGNHDQKRVKALEKLFVWCKYYHELRHLKQHIVLMHYGMRVWNRHHHGSWHLYGHSHGTLPSHGLSIDVGVDAHNYYPVSFSEVSGIMAARKREIIDHHG